MSLRLYHQKRRFDSTPEPRGIEHTVNRQRFVVQKHHATALHYDLRLEWRGTMLSWAVPKGPSDNPKDKHLAAHVEDHPLEYRHFEGVIPSGYGAGVVMVWDYGTFEWVTRSRDQYTFIAHGTKLKGEYTLIRFKRAGERSWLLMKVRDRYARTGKFLINRSPISAITGRTLDQIEQGAPAKASFLKKVEGARRAGLPRKLGVMKPTLIDKPFSDPEWIFEPKWDGFRGMAVIDGGHVKLVSRNALDLLDRFPSLRHIDKAFAARRAVVDGEVVRLDKKGISRFTLLKGEGPSDEQAHTQYAVFDLLHLDGYDLTHVPLEQRKALLRAIVRPDEHVRYTDHIEVAGETFFDQTGKDGAEGMVAKERMSVYEPVRSRAWLKIKHNLEQEFVVGGWSEGEGGREGSIGALLLGVYPKRGSKGPLEYAGRVGSGFTEDLLADLARRLKKLATKRSPFSGPVPGPRVHFVTPHLMAQAKFEEWTPDGRLRQPVFLGLRDDKPLHDVVREQSVSATVVRDPKATTRQTAPRSDVLPGIRKVRPSPALSLPKSTEHVVDVGGQHLKFTNLKKPYWTQPRLTKGDFIEYCYRIAPIVLPHLKDRPLSMKRYVEGINGPFFYQKNVPAPRPRFLETIPVKHREGITRYVLVNDVETLLWAANLADLELHPWYSRRGSLGSPDFVVFDLDPTPSAGLEQVRYVAQVIKEVLDELGLVGYPKTSGKRGIHIYVPITPRFTYDDTKLFAKQVTNLVHRLEPARTTLEFYKRKRHGVYIDYLQNIKGKTLASAYSLRAVPGAPVSAPLTWREVERGFKMQDFNYKTILRRVATIGDLFAGTLTNKQNLAPALKRLRALDQ